MDEQSNLEKASVLEVSFSDEIGSAKKFMEEKISGLTLIHSRGVAKIGKQLAIMENANPAIVQIAAFFHDIAKDETSFEKHTSVACEIFSDFVASQKWKLSDEFVQEIKHCIASHSFGWCRIGEEPRTIEAMVLFDADMLQQLSPFGIVKHIHKYINEPPEEQAKKIRSDLEQAFEKISTPSGIILGKDGIGYVRDFLNNVLEG